MIKTIGFNSVGVRTRKRNRETVVSMPDQTN